MPYSETVSHRIRIRRARAPLIAYAAGSHKHHPHATGGIGHSFSFARTGRGEAGGVGAPALAPDRLEYLGQLDIKDLRSSSSKVGSKITGLLVVPPRGALGSPGDGMHGGHDDGHGGGVGGSLGGDGDYAMIVTSADSRLRRYAGYTQVRGSIASPGHEPSRTFPCVYAGGARQ